MVEELARIRELEYAVEWSLEMHYVVVVSSAMFWPSFEEGTTWFWKDEWIDDGGYGWSWWFMWVENSSGNQFLIHWLNSFCRCMSDDVWIWRIVVWGQTTNLQISSRVMKRRVVVVGWQYMLFKPVWLTQYCCSVIVEGRSIDVGRWFAMIVAACLMSLMWFIYVLILRMVEPILYYVSPEINNMNSGIKVWDIVAVK